MKDRDRISAVIYDAIDELNQQRPEMDRLQKMPETALFSESGPLDSLGLVNFVVSVEDVFEIEFGYSISLMDERSRSQEVNPFQSVETLSHYICGLVEEKTTP